MSEEFNIPGFTEQESKPLNAVDTYADIVFCIDLTGSMSPIIDRVKEVASTLHEKLQKEMNENYHRNIIQLRIKVIGFRDFYDGAAPALKSSEFFNLPEETDKFVSFVNELQAMGGGDIPENSLEALALAMQSDWSTTIDTSLKKRHIIILFTDASAHPLEDAATREKVKEYPENMPESYQELMDMWYGQSKGVTTLHQNAKRMFVFAPAGTDPWEGIASDFDQCGFLAIEPNKGGCDISTDTLITIVGGTIN